MINTVFPNPVKVEETEGHLSLNSSVLAVLNELTIKIESSKRALEENLIFFDIVSSDKPQAEIGNEGYNLIISEEKVQITSNSITGSYYAIQTLRWLIKSEFLKENSNESDIIQLKCCKITDYPRFPYRGYMLDEARYFLGIKTVKSVLDWMALIKLNRFHWHLTEDQGWRIEIKKYPRLTGIGSKRSSTPIYRNTHEIMGDKNSDGIFHEGFYTQDQIREIISYAKSRNIEVIPEIEIPGHATAALVSYPEYRCILPDDIPPEGANVLGSFLDGTNLKVSTRWGVHANTFCVSNPKTIEFIKDVLKEVIDLFPSQIIHIGGDEVPKIQWMCCEKCQERMETLGLGSEEELQTTFTADIIDYITNLGKKTMLWNEHTDESLAKRKDHVICQYWTGSLEKVSAFAEQGGKLVMSPSKFIYMDIAYNTLPLEKVYQYEPLNQENLQDMSKEAYDKLVSGGVLGIEAPMWGEVFQNRSQVEYCTFPRILAVADLAWSPCGNKNYSKFLERTASAFPLLDEMGIHHATLEHADPTEDLIEIEKKNPKFGHYAYFD